MILDRLAEIVFPTARTPRRRTRSSGGVGRFLSQPRYRAVVALGQATVIAQPSRRACGEFRDRRPAL